MEKTKALVDPMEVARLLAYDRATGQIVWRVHAGKCVPGDVAGCIGHDGYRAIWIGGKRLTAHRIAWAIETGEWPPKGSDIDHANRNRDDNRWSNLRLASRSQNNMNAKTRKDNGSGRKGVCQRSDTGRWLAYISAHGKIVRLGSFATKEEAIAAREAAEPIHHQQFARSA